MQVLKNGMMLRAGLSLEEAATIVAAWNTIAQYVNPPQRAPDAEPAKSE